MTDMPRQRHHTAIATAYGQTALLGAFMFRATRFVAKANPAVDFVDNDGVQRSGVAWTHEKWAEELGTTPDIFRRSVLEIAEDLSWLVRAQGPWGRHRVNRMHIAVTETYVAELAMCVKLGPKAYIAVTKSKIKAGFVQSIAQRQLRNKQRVARDTLATVAIDTPATVAVDTLAIRSQSPLLGTDTARVLGSDCDAGFAVIRNLDPKNYALGEERSLRSLPTSPSSAAPLHARGVQFHGYEAAYSLGGTTTRSPDLARKLGVPATVADNDADEKQVVGPTDDLRDPTPTVTGDGLARKLRLLGVLEDWKSVCADYGVPVADNATDDQLEALDWWCERMELNSVALCERRLRMAHFIENWGFYGPAFVAADDWVGMTTAPDKPTLEFVRQIADVMRPQLCAA